MEIKKMEQLKLLKGDFASKLALALAPTIKAGFPSPADDYLHDSLDFNRDMIKNPEATFYGRVSGDSMIEAGICDGDIIVAFVNGEFTIKYLDLRHKHEGYIELRPANPNYSPIHIDADDNFRVWGVVVWTIKQWRK